MSSGLRLIDGSQIASLLSSIYDEDPQFDHIFDEARGHHGSNNQVEHKQQQGDEDMVDSSQFLSVAMSLINQANGGTEIPSKIMDEALQSTQMNLLYHGDGEDDDKKKNNVVMMDRPTFASKLGDLLRSIVCSLQGNLMEIHI